MKSERKNEEKYSYVNAQFDIVGGFLKRNFHFHYKEIYSVT